MCNMDGIALDRQYGVCPVLLYEFTENDWQLLSAGKRTDELAHRLKELGIFQYFFPPPDQLALGLVDRSTPKIETISSAIDLAPKLGHPLGEPELTEGPNSVPALIDELLSKGLLVEGELGLEITPTGSSTRATVKFRPREGFVSKLLQRFNVKVSLNPTDLLPR